MEFGRNPLSMTSTQPTLLNVLDEVGEAASHIIPKVDVISPTNGSLSLTQSVILNTLGGVQTVYPDDKSTDNVPGSTITNQPVSNAENQCFDDDPVKECCATLCLKCVAGVFKCVFYTCFGLCTECN